MRRERERMFRRYVASKRHTMEVDFDDYLYRLRRRPRIGVPMPTFCRHNRLIQNCPICSREQAIELRPVVTSSAPRTTQPRPSGPSQSRPRPRSEPARSSGSGGLKVRRLARGTDDGYRSPLLPGLKSSQEASRLAEELAFGAARLNRLAANPPGLYADVADAGTDVEERTWLAFLIAYLSPLEGVDPFAGVHGARVAWASGEEPRVSDAQLGPRSAHDAAHGTRTIDAYRAWAGRAGSQAVAFAGEPAWTPERRFARVFERLALPGLNRDARFDLLVTLGALAVYELRAGSLALGGDNRVTLAAKRALGIGDPLLLERRAGELADACGLPLAALDLGFYNWEGGERFSAGLEPDAEPDPAALARTHDALGL
jgi:hypothetical protein